MLRPGVRVSRRDLHTLQVGLEPGARATLPDTDAMRVALAGLAPGPVQDPTVDLDDETARAAVATLHAHGLLVERHHVTSALTSLRDPVRRAAMTAVFAQHPTDGDDRLRDRAEASVSLRCLGDARIVRTWAATVAELLDTAGVGRVTIDGDPAADATLVLSAAEPDRDQLDVAMTTGAPHLVVTVAGGAARVGPFVLPGYTACLRCVDAHLDEHDERRGVVLSQVTGDDTAPLALPAPSDPALTTLALAWAARDLVTFVEGDRPATWSATVDLDVSLDVVTRPWLRHPHCGCCWGDLVDAI
jgi:bacteriocin biosynthesis cyclodehydratase domain-containing protein